MPTGSPSGPTIGDTALVATTTTSGCRSATVSTTQSLKSSHSVHGRRFCGSAWTARVAEQPLKTK